MQQSSYEISLKRFDDLSVYELYDIYRLRTEVFVVEQNCPYQEVEETDLYSYHYCLYDKDSLVAYLRIIDKGVSYDQVSIGRVCVAPQLRGTGLGRKIMADAISFVADEMHESGITIKAESYLEDFYRSFGFKQTSEVFLLDDIPHEMMDLVF